jgi:hypothetical protein
LSFDTPGEDSATCGVQEDFNDGVADGWTQIDPGWSVVVDMGPDHSGAFQVLQRESFLYLTHPSILGVTSATVDADFRIDGAINGDFDVLFAKPGWTNPPEDGAPYEFFEISPVGSDNAQDILFRLENSFPSNIDQQPVMVNAGEYHHETVSFAGTELSSSLDGVPYLSGTDPMMTPPYDVIIGFYNGGVIDNIAVTCTR